MKTKNLKKKISYYSFIFFVILSLTISNSPVSAAEGDFSPTTGQSYTWQITSVNDTVYPQYVLGDQFMYLFEAIEYWKTEDFWYILYMYRNFNDEADDLLSMNSEKVRANGSEASGVGKFIPKLNIEQYLIDVALQESYYNASGNIFNYTSGKNEYLSEFNTEGVLTKYTHSEYGIVALIYSLLGESISFGTTFVGLLLFGVISSVYIYYKKIRRDSSL